MRWLLFLSRVAFICNVFFIIAVSLQISNWIRNADIASTVVMIGYVMVAILNPAVNVLYLLTFVLSRSKLRGIPAWLITANILFLVMQIFYILCLNDTRHS